MLKPNKSSGTHINGAKTRLDVMAKNTKSTTVILKMSSTPPSKVPALVSRGVNARARFSSSLATPANIKRSLDNTFHTGAAAA
jgi:hypothetical protein